MKKELLKKKNSMEEKKKEGNLFDCRAKRERSRKQGWEGEIKRLENSPKVPTFNMIFRMQNRQQVERISRCEETGLQIVRTLRMQKRMYKQTSPKTCSSDVFDTADRGKILNAKIISHSERNENPVDISQIIGNSRYEGKKIKKHVWKMLKEKCF